MFAHRTITGKLACFLMACLFLLLLSGTGNACRMYGVIGNDLPADLLQTHLISAPNSLEVLSHSQLDGWGIAYYPQYGNNPILARASDPCLQRPQTIMTAWWRTSILPRRRSSSPTSGHAPPGAAPTARHHSQPPSVLPGEERQNLGFRSQRCRQQKPHVQPAG